MANALLVCKLGVRVDDDIVMADALFDVHFCINTVVIIRVLIECIVNMHLVLIVVWSSALLICISHQEFYGNKSVGRVQY